MSHFADLPIVSRKRRCRAYPLLIVIAGLFVAYLTLFWTHGDQRIKPCVGRDSQGKPFAVLTPPPERMIIQRDEQGGTTLLAGNSEGDIGCRFTSWGNTLENTETWLSPDGSRVIWAYTDWRYDIESLTRYYRHHLYTMNKDGTNLVAIAYTVTLLHPNQLAWSPDNERIAFANNEPGGWSPEIHVMNANGTQARSEIIGTGTIHSLLWAHNGEQIAVALHGILVNDINPIGIYLIDSRTLTFRRLVQPDARIYFSVFAWSSDDQAIVYGMGESIDTDDQITYTQQCTVNIDGTENRCTDL